MPAIAPKPLRPKKLMIASASQYESGPLITDIRHRKLKSIRIIASFRLCLHFRDDFISEIAFEKWVKKSSAGPLRKPLRDAEYFAQVYLDHGALTWPNGYDIDPCAVRHWAEQGFCD